MGAPLTIYDVHLRHPESVNKLSNQKKIFVFEMIFENNSKSVTFKDPERNSIFTIDIFLVLILIFPNFNHDDFLIIFYCFNILRISYVFYKL